MRSSIKCVRSNDLDRSNHTPTTLGILCPQIFVGGKSIGGSDRLEAMILDGSFRKLLEGSSTTGASPALPSSLLPGAVKAWDEAERLRKEGLDRQADSPGVGASGSQPQELAAVMRSSGIIMSSADLG